MSSNDVFYKKYLNYKNKYIKLKNQMTAGASLASFACKYCTFENESGSLCQMCGKTKILEKSSTSFTCKYCTFENDSGSICQMCGKTNTFDVKADTKVADTHGAVSSCFFKGTRVVSLNEFVSEYKSPPPEILKLRRVFSGPTDWKLVDPRGDGKCMIYGILETLKIYPKDLTRFLYTTIIKQFEIEEELVFPKSNGDIVIITKQDSEEEIITKLLDILDDDNLSDIFIRILSRFTNTNILFLRRDSKSSEPYQLQYYRSDQPRPNNLILLNFSGHYRTIYSDDPLETQRKIDEIIRDKKW